MYYFLSDIHGAAEAYFEMKRRIDFKEKDEMYILGDIFDGNSKEPKACIEILEDIMQNKNIHLLLGDHEYVHIMCYLMEEEEKDNPDIENIWREIVLKEDFQGEPLYHYFREELSAQKQKIFISYLLSCELSDVVSIGSKYIYLIHGAPTVCKENEEMKWQYDVVTEELSLSKNYHYAIKSDPNFSRFVEKYGTLNPSEMIIMTGHVPTPIRFEMDESLQDIFPQGQKQSKIIYINNRFLLDCGCDGDTLGENQDGWYTALACVGIDAAGFFVEKIPKLKTIL